MTAASDDLPLAAEFPAATHAQWRKLVDGVLKGAPFEKLQSRSADGLTIEPLYPRAAAAAPIAGRAPGTRWQVMQRIDHPDPDACNAEVLHELDNGADGLVLIPAGAIGAHGYGLAPSAERRRTCACRRPSRCRHLDRARIQPACPRAADGACGIGQAARSVTFRGRHPLRPRSARRFRPAWRDVRALARDTRRASQRSPPTLSKRGFKGPFATADGRVVHDAGGTEAQELAFALAAAVAYLRAFEAGGIALDAARRMIAFRLDRRRRPVPDHREIPRDAEALAARRGKLRPRAGPRLRRGGDRLALDDPRRRLCEHPARDHRRVLGRRRRRRCDHGPAVHRRARPARPLRAACCAQHAARAARRSRHRACRRSDRRRRLERGPDRQALPRGLDACSRRSKPPAASPPRSNGA